MLERGATPSSAKRFCTSGALSALSSSACRRLITAGGVFAGAAIAFQEETSYPFTPASIVNDAQLAETARRLGFPEMIQLGAGMRAAGGTDNSSILADAFEAFVAALCISYGLERARKCVVAEHVERHDHSAATVLDAKTRLQHYAQAHLSATPVYRETSRGTPQRPAFTI